jgi:RimJ/RimL family protein N-acetyltransferase
MDPPGAQLTTPRLALDPLRPEDADEMAEVLGDPRLYAFIGGEPPTVEQLRDRYRRLAVGRSPDGLEEWRNWIIRGRTDRRSVGTVQATITDRGRRADIAWVIGQSWQGQGFASEAAQALVRWLEARGVPSITAHVHPDHQASAIVASRAGLEPTAEIEDGERVWLRGPGGAAG